MRGGQICNVLRWDGQGFVDELNLGVRDEGETGIRHAFLGSWLKQLDEQRCHSLRRQTERVTRACFSIPCSISVRMKLKKKKLNQ